MRSIAVAILLALSLFWGGPAQACTVDRYGPYDPTQYPADLVIGGTVVDDGIVGGEPFADIQVEDVFVGAFAQTTYRLKWWIDGGGRCSPPGPDLKTGQQVLIYLRDTDGDAMGWAPLYRMGSPLPTVRDTMPDHLLARFSREGWLKDVPRSRLDEPLDLDGLRASEYRIIGADTDLRGLVLSDQAAAVQRDQRERDYFYVGGARSVNDPAKWFTPSEKRAILGKYRGVEVRFSVGADGKINDCHAADADLDRLMATKLCALLRQRAKMVAPLFEDEKSGYFEMRRPGG